MQVLTHRIGLMLVVLASVVFAGCSDGGNDDEQDDDASAVSSLTVTLSEWRIKAESTHVNAGEVTFNVRNEGAAPHELVVVRTNLSANKLPVASGFVDEEQAVPVGRTANVNNGKSETLILPVTPGTYVLFCNIHAHYGQGMSMALMVK